MKILTHDSLKAAGGINRRVKELKKYISKNEKLVIIKLMEDNNIHKEENITVYNCKLPSLIDCNFPYNNINSESEARNKFIPLSKEIDKIIKIEKPDIALVMGTFFLPWSIMQSLKENNVPILHLYIGSASTEFYPSNNPLIEFYKPLERDFLNFSDYTIFNSEHGLNKVKDLFGSLPKKYSIVWNGVNEEMFKFSPKNERNGIGYIARYDLFKNPLFLLELNSKLRAAGFIINFNLISNLNPNIPCYQDCINADFKIQGQTTNEAELRDFYQSRLMCISPSKFETFGNVALESLASGIPCLVSSGAGSSEVFKKLGLEDLIFDPENIEEACSMVININKSQIIIPDRIRKQIKFSYSWHNTLTKYFQIIYKILGGKYGFF